MIFTRNFVLYSISLLSMFESLFFMLAIFLPNSSLLAETSLLTELQEVGPLLLGPIIGEDLLLYDAPQYVEEQFPSLLLVAIARYVGVLGFSSSVFYSSMHPVWPLIMITCMSLSFIHFCASAMMFLYIISSKKRPELLLPWIFSTILLLGTTLAALLCLEVFMVISLDKVQVQEVHSYTIIILCLTCLLLFAQIFQVMAEFKNMQRGAVWLNQRNGTKVKFDKDMEHPTVENFNIKPALPWTNSSSSTASSIPLQDQDDQSSSTIMIQDQSQSIEIPDFHILPLSAFLGQQPHAEVPIFHFNNQPWYFPPHQPYSDPQPYPPAEPYPSNQSYPDEKQGTKTL